MNDFLVIYSKTIVVQADSIPHACEVAREMVGVEIRIDTVVDLKTRNTVCMSEVGEHYVNQKEEV